ncbi:SDR family oxidoreductase [Arthrobacter sp. B2a2-09]|uniref:SDR family oxidoreductase n=1 Tax=Arthrobacter sp. B2a2-09 TaxID=2952822 RepID=UPI0022CDA1A6|nr:SDR family oxidoreductase [Arthrobacter sp. B2a2-09]MCZ9880385.1 SDR family oxidoreductase [Arthrobacter sp. B2a2-09]
MTDSGPVLVVGGTGMLGSQVVSRLLTGGKQVRALVRPGSDASRLEEAGATIARGDMMDPESLARAMEGVDAVITSAAGYTHHREGDSTVIDTVGNINLVDAASRAGIRRFVLTSILTCDQTPDLPHFWHKKLTEDRLEERGVPFVALRPGAFLDQITRFGDPFSEGRITWFGSSSVPLTFVLTRDLAGYLAAAVDASGVDGQRIDIGWDRPVTMQDIADISAQMLGRQVQLVVNPVNPINPMAKDLGAMMDWFQTGRYVADTSRQREVFGPPPSAEDAVARLLTGLGHKLA